MRGIVNNWAARTASCGENTPSLQRFALSYRRCILSANGKTCDTAKCWTLRLSQRKRTKSCEICRQPGSFGTLRKEACFPDKTLEVHVRESNAIGIRPLGDLGRALLRFPLNILQVLHSEVRVRYTVEMQHRKQAD